MLISEGGCTLGQDGSNPNSEEYASSEENNTSIESSASKEDTPPNDNISSDKVSSAEDAGSDETIDSEQAPANTTSEETASSEEKEISVEVVTTEVPICPTGYYGDLPHPALCSSFYKCLGFGEPLLLTCPAGFEFDSEILVSFETHNLMLDMDLT